MSNKEILKWYVHGVAPCSRKQECFNQSARQRLEDGQFLFEGRRNTGAVGYLAGYAVECMLKAMILSALPARKRKMMLDSFRGQQAHDYEWLKAKYWECQGLTVPRARSNAISFWRELLGHRVAIQVGKCASEAGATFFARG